MIINPYRGGGGGGSAETVVFLDQYSGSAGPMNTPSQHAPDTAPAHWFYIEWSQIAQLTGTGEYVPSTGFGSENTASPYSNAGSLISIGRTPWSIPVTSSSFYIEAVFDLNATAGPSDDFGFDWWQMVEAPGGAASSYIGMYVHRFLDQVECYTIPADNTYSIGSLSGLVTMKAVVGATSVEFFLNGTSLGSQALDAYPTALNAMDSYVSAHDMGGGSWTVGASSMKVALL